MEKGGLYVKSRQEILDKISILTKSIETKNNSIENLEKRIRQSELEIGQMELDIVTDLESITEEECRLLELRMELKKYDFKIIK